LCVLCNCMYCAIVCTVQLCVLCNCMYCAIVCTVQLCVLYNCVYCAIVCTVQLCVLCSCVYCAIVCTVQLCVLCNCHQAIILSYKLLKVSSFTTFTHKPIINKTSFLSVSEFFFTIVLMLERCNVNTL